VDVGEPIREIEVVPEHIPVPVREPDKNPSPTPAPKEKEIVRSNVEPSRILG
jgi:hypothetical protein